MHSTRGARRLGGMSPRRNSDWAAVIAALCAVTASAAPEQVELPEVIDPPVHLVRAGSPSLTWALRFVFARPVRELCYRASRPVAFTVRFDRADGVRDESFWDKGPRAHCLRTPALESTVTVELGAPIDGPFELAFFDPELRPDPLDWTLEGERLVDDAFPFLHAGLNADQGVRERAFLTGPLALMRYLKKDLQADDVKLERPYEHDELPHRGEPLMALRVKGSETRVCTLDGLEFWIRSDALSDVPVTPATWPSFGRWKFVDEEASTEVLPLGTAKGLAMRGSRLAATYAKEWEAQDTCFSNTWKKLDPGYDPKTLVLAWRNGTTRTLSELVDQRVRKLCKTDAYEKRRLKLSEQIREERGQDYARTLAAFQQRWSTP